MHESVTQASTCAGHNSEEVLETRHQCYADRDMSFLGNLIWIVVCGGLITCVEYLIVGIVLCLTVIFTPFGVQCFKMADLALMPFGRRIVPDLSAGKASLVLNLLWFVVAGFWIALTHLAFALACALTIIGIPFAVQHLKLAALGVWPFGKRVIH